MTIRQLKLNFQSQLKSLFPTEEIDSFFNLLSEAYLGYSRFEVSVNAGQEVSGKTLQQFSEALQRLQQLEPIQYILGETEFYGLTFKVTPATLIPRPETEELVNVIIKLNTSYLINENEKRTFLDIGTGSGCIAISLAKHIKNASVSALDISEAALQVASRNAKTNNVSIDFIQGDILETAKLSKKYDVIVSNPPYVRELEKEQMHANVLEYEPDEALFVSNEDPLIFYQKIAQLACNHLKPKGKLYFEINEYLGSEMKELLASCGFLKIDLKKDLYGKDRMIIAEL